jgi:GNAT superfamily N-acetyltransferase
VLAEPTIRPAREADLPDVVELIREHIAYERAEGAGPGLADRLATLVFSAVPRVHVLVAEGERGLVGYAAASREASVWQGDEYLHLDCLFLRDSARGQGIGGLLLAEMRALAASFGLHRMQWQTPTWNTDAIRFYDRTGAQRSSKERYTLPV